MLKIKDNVGLKQLEKFGFKYDDNYGHFKFGERNIEGLTFICVKTWNRRITFRQGYDFDTECLNVLYHLIKADLVEEVN